MRGSIDDLGCLHEPRFGRRKDLSDRRSQARSKVGSDSSFVNVESPKHRVQRATSLFDRPNLAEHLNPFFQPAAPELQSVRVEPRVALRVTPVLEIQEFVPC